MELAGQPILITSLDDLLHMKRRHRAHEGADRSQSGDREDAR